MAKMGRPKGSISKKAYKMLLAQDVCQQRKVNPFEVMAQVMIHGETEEIRLKAAKELGSYIQAKPVHVHLEHINPPVLQVAVNTPRVIEGMATEVSE